MGTSTIQRSFAGGVIAPALFGRADQAKFQTGLEICLNFIVQREGGVTNRPGFQYLVDVKTAGGMGGTAGGVELLKFVFNDAQTYILEFGHLYMRVLKDGGQVTLPATTITGATQANPVVITSVAHGYSNGDEVFISGVVGMTEINNCQFIVANVTANTYELTGIDGSAFTAYVSGGTAVKIFDLVTPYADVDVEALQFVQSADVVTIVHPLHAPMDLKRTADDAWTLTTIQFLPEIARPRVISASPGPGGTTPATYLVTAIAIGTREESLPGTVSLLTITGITQADPAVVTSVAHGLSNGDQVLIESVVGMVEVNDRTFTVQGVAANTFELANEDSTGHTAYSSAGTAGRISTSLVGGTPTGNNPHVVSWTAVAGALRYNVYKAQAGFFGFMGFAFGTTFDDVGNSPNLGDGPPFGDPPFIGAGNFPATVTYFQQRLCFANLLNDPERIFMSRTAAFHNFTASIPSQDDDSINFVLAGRQVNEVRHLLELGRLLAFTSGSEWIIRGDSAGIVKPSAINARQVGHVGSNLLPPIPIATTALFMQARGQITRDLIQTDEDIYRGRDLSIFASHLFREGGFDVIEWDYQQNPHSILWAVQSSGILLGLTYVPEHDVWGWHRHFVGGVGRIDDVAVVPEGDEDVVYIVVGRSGQKTIERMVSRQVDNIFTDAKFLDSHLSYNGTNLTLAGFDSAATMTLIGGPPWGKDDVGPFIVTASTPTFVFPGTADVGNKIVYDNENTSTEGKLNLTILSVTSSTVAVVKPDRDIDLAYQGTAIDDWCKAVDQLVNLKHLDGARVSILADGSTHDDKTVVNKVLTLDRVACHIHVGYGYNSDLKTLKEESLNGETLLDKNILINELSIFVEKSRGFFVAPGFVLQDNLNAEALEVKPPEHDDYDTPIPLFTGVLDISVEGGWSHDSSIWIRQKDPLPLTILTLIPHGEVEGDD